MTDYPYGSERLAKWRKSTDTPLVVIALGSLPILLLDLIEDRLPPTDRNIISAVHVLVAVAFLIDYLVEIFLAERKVEYARHEWTNLLIVVTQGLAIIPGLEAFRVLRLARGLRPLIFVASLFSIRSSKVVERRRALRTNAHLAAIAVAGMVWISSAVAFTLVEDVGTGKRVDSFGDALWWSAATISTVGYGDIYPVTIVGRLIAVFTMLVGVSVFGVLTASIARSLLKESI